MVPCGVVPGAATPTPTPAPAPTKAPPSPSPTPTPTPFPTPRPSISDFSLSTVKRGVGWSGSTSGQIYNTMDGGKTWNNVTNFTDLPPGSNFVTVEAGHSDVNTAYVLANLGRGGGGPGAPQQGPHYHYITDCGGQNLARIVNG